LVTVGQVALWLLHFDAARVDRSAAAVSWVVRARTGHDHVPGMCSLLAIRAPV